MENHVLLTAENLTRYYRQGFWLRKKYVLTEVSLSIVQGEAIGLIGPNGAGKTTLLKVLTGIDFPQKGSVNQHSLIPGQPKLVIGFAPEAPYFPDHFTVRQYLEYLCRISGQDRKERVVSVKSVLKQFDLSDLKDKRIRTLSKGQKQRLNLAQAIVDNPDLLILDEPLSGLDPRWREYVRRLLLEWREQGKTIIFSSHILEDVQLVSDRILLIQDGKLAWQGRLGDMDAVEGYNVLAHNMDRDFTSFLLDKGITMQRGTDSVFFIWPRSHDIHDLYQAALQNKLTISQISVRLKTVQ